ncbi:hypothetical protein A2U01_0034037, partial [Trifolium medium]|nr:hypothetical protein [Trifolium medium]
KATSNTAHLSKVDVELKCKRGHLFYNGQVFGTNISPKSPESRPDLSYSGQASSPSLLTILSGDNPRAPKWFPKLLMVTPSKNSTFLAASQLAKTLANKHRARRIEGQGDHYFAKHLQLKV